MIEEARLYFQDVVQTIDPDMVQLDDPFDSEDVSTEATEGRFKIIFGDSASSWVGDALQELIPVSVVIYSENGREMNEIFDQYYSKARNIRNMAINKRNSANSSFFNDVLPGGITPEPIDVSNDNTVKFTINFSLKIDFKLC